MLCVAEGKPSTIDFEAGLAAQEVLEAAYRSAARGGERIDLPLE
jgi:predicted dehydrogenase